MRRPKGLIAIFFLALLCNCSKEPTPTDTLIIGIESEIRNLDLRSAADANSAHVISIFSQSLVRPDDRLLPTTDLATSFGTIGSKVYFFNLPEGATFHDGRPLDCRDVKASFEQAAGPQSKVRSSFSTVKEFRCPTPLRFEIELQQPLTRFLMADVAQIRIMPREIAVMQGKAPPIGSGPYKYVGNNYRDLIFERFDNFKRFKDGKPEAPYFYKNVIVRTLADPSIRWLSINAGDIDALMNALSPLRVLEAENTHGLKVYQGPGTTFQYLAINLKTKKFQDLRVRQAMALALDRDAIIKHKLFGMAVKADSVLSPVNFFHNPALKGPEYDPEKARMLLKESGNLGMEIEIKCSTDADSLANVLVMAQQLREVGFKVNLRTYEFGTFLGDVMKGNFEMYSLRWTGVTDPDLLQRIFHSKEFPPGRNRTFYVNPKVDELLVKAGSEENLQKRQNLYNKVQEIVLEDLPYIPLWYPANIAVLRASINGFTPHPTGSWENLLKSTKTAHEP